MVSLLHPHFPGSKFRGTDAEALSYLKDTGWTSRMATPSPAVHLAGGLLLVGAGTWAGVAVGRHHLAVGIGLGVVAAALALLDLLPAAWTLSHRQYTGQYLAARLRYGSGRPRLHPYVVLVGLPVLTALAAAFTPADGSVTTRLTWGVLGAAIGLVAGLLRVARATRTIPPTTSLP
ncbi:MAG: hypothetical protein QOI76_3845 [Frankiales bacterium]|jgi:hypothetical protein|nr:hypothetical protein [Frankiales bacterium]